MGPFACPMAAPTYLERLEAEAVHLIREVIAESDRPVLLFWGDVESCVLLHVAREAFGARNLPFPVLHVDSGWEFREITLLRDRLAADGNLQLLVVPRPHASEHAVGRPVWRAGVGHALATHRFDLALEGTRDEVVSISPSGADQPSAFRPSHWRLCNTRRRQGEGVRAHPLSGWSDLDLWRYVAARQLSVAPLYLSRERPVVRRRDRWIIVDDARLPLERGESPELRAVRVPMICEYPVCEAVDSTADTVPKLIEELATGNLEPRLEQPLTR